MDEPQNIQSDELDEATQKALTKVKANTERAKQIIEEIKSEAAERQKKLDEFEHNIEQTARNMKAAFNELDKDEAEAMDELDALNLQFAEDMAKLDTEDEAEEKAEEEEKEDEE